MTAKTINEDALKVISKKKQLFNMIFKFQNSE